MIDAGDVLSELVRDAADILWTVETPQDQRIAELLTQPTPSAAADIAALLTAFDPLDLGPSSDEASPYEPVARSIVESVPPALNRGRAGVETALWDGLAILSEERPGNRYRFEKLLSHLYDSFRVARKRWGEHGQSF